MTALPYRLYELPWTADEDEQQRLRRVLAAAATVFVVLGIAIPLLPGRPALTIEHAATPERVVEFLLTRPPLPPPEPVPAVRPEPKPRVAEHPTPKPEPRPVEPRPDPRRKAASSGLLAAASELAQLRELVAPTPTRSLSTARGERSEVDRTLLTAKVGEGSGGISVPTGGPIEGTQSRLAGYSTARVSSPAAAARASQDAGGTVSASRTREEIELVFDRNKAAIHALYARALRENPALHGKVVLQFTIAPSGEVTDCRVLSSELAAPELETKLAARVRMFRFEARDVATMTTTKPIDFFPA